MRYTVSLPAVVIALSLLAQACGKQPFHIKKADPQTKRSLTSGDVVGGNGRYGSQAWLGIPYAQPPAGALRWRKPEPVKTWSGTRETLSFGEPCPQFAAEFGGVEGSRGTVVGNEDCLTLNVYGPPIAAGNIPQGNDRLPVMVWIHGGGNSIGTSNTYDGGALAVSQNVIVVNIQYRLGPLGWFRHAALRAGAATDEDRSGNFGTLDQIFALRWVKENIAAFGGNPDNVTIFGESAGARNVFSLLLSPSAKGLFHRAIAQSGGVSCSSVTDAENFAVDAVPGDKKSSSEIALALLVSETQGNRDEAMQRLAAMTTAATEAFLRSKSPEDLLNAYHIKSLPMLIFPQLFSDGAVLPAACTPQTLARSDAWNQVPVMIGTNRDEARLFMFANPRFVKRRLGIIPRFVVDEETYMLTSNYISRWIKITGADEPGQAVHASGQKAFVYRFDWDEEPTVFGADLSKMLGAAHGLEIPFVFGHWDLGSKAKNIYDDDGLPSRLALSKAMMAYWAQFARTGDPAQGGATLPAWRAWDAATTSTSKYIVFDTAAGGGIRMSNDVESIPQLIDSMVDDVRLREDERCTLVQVVASFSRGRYKAENETRVDCSQVNKASLLDF